MGLMEPVETYDYYEPNADMIRVKPSKLGGFIYISIITTNVLPLISNPSYAVLMKRKKLYGFLLVQDTV
jgi:hypothetical protein